VLKEDLRALYKKKRNFLDQKKSQDLSFEIANRSLQLNIWDYSNYHVFFPIENNNEIDTKLIIQIIQGKDKNVVLPKTNFKNKTITNYLLTDATLLTINKHGISEPKSGIEISENQLEVVFIPLICFDKTGHRVGYGGGYYDRLLEKCSSNCIKIGLSFFDPEDRIEDITQSDIKMNHCITPSKTYNF
jgi:5-formyltetrahydrofolate cyclo-ligase